jgi:hypothetical protein
MPPLASPSRLSAVLVTLLKGTIDRNADPKRWQDLLDCTALARDHLAILGLDLLVNEAEGYAFVRQKDMDDDADAIPRLIRRRPLTFEVSLVLALIRKHQAEHEATSGERCIITTHQVSTWLHVFVPETGDERKLMRDARRPLREIADLGFLRPLKDREDEFEVLRILKAHIDAQWLNTFSDRLEQYRQHAVAKLAEEGT